MNHNMSCTVSIQRGLGGAFARMFAFLCMLAVAAPHTAFGEKPVPAALKAPARVPAGDVLIQVVAREHVTIAAGMDGRIERLMVREGDRFTKGMLLLAFDCSSEQGMLERSKASRELAVKNAEIQEKLFAMGASSDLELSTARAERGKMAAEQKIAAAAVRKCTVLAPFSGGVSELKVQRFQTVKKGDPLMRLVNTGDLEIQMFVPSKWLVWLKPGRRFTVHVDELDRDYQAEVRATGTWIDAVSQSVAVFSRFSRQAPELLPGMSGHAILASPK
ncbi:conserved hypothetical protein [Pelodictyon luteolum DSM 273]|uniref:Multidrug resistance protein MdtA-like barrel-sandwich hybrid domain-containing protein n=2 Tax=Pelodictyon luteolum TaxID=1100 RepID=Q3B5X3_CHLL3|nr:conserved hypothetical protein [Pelodictyon luteolum DSM 273]